MTPLRGNAPDMELERRRFQTTIDGKPVDLYGLRNARGTVVKITNYGSRIEQILVPDRTGAIADVVLGYESIAAVQSGQASMGAFIGRYANRIAGAAFSLDGNEYRLTANNGPNTLHGGLKGSRFCVFDAEQLGESSVRMSYVYADGEEGFPGNVRSAVEYTLADDDTLTLAFEAVTDRPTVVNFTDHSYFNLAGAGKGDILGHVLHIAADCFTVVDASGLPTGELRSLAGTPLDFRTPLPIGTRIGADDQQLRFQNGYDFNYVLNAGRGTFALAATLYEPASGRVLEVLTTQPGLQLFSGNNLSGAVPRDLGKGGAAYGFRSAVCLEGQHFPDSPHHPHFPSTVLRPGEHLRGRIAYRFSVRE